VDYIAPQLYWRIDPPAQSYPVLLQWWTENNPKQKHIYAGNRLSSLDGKDWTIEEYKRQVEISRNLASKLSLGNIFYSMSVLQENRLEVFDKFKTSLYAEPALAPVMSWLDSQLPKPPEKVRVRDGKLTWQARESDKIRAWTLYRQVNGSWKLEKVLGADSREIAVESGTYALCAVDRLSRESLGAAIAV
jgi:hypothetical protein